jgi:hypothetical protein
MFYTGRVIYNGLGKVEFRELELNDGSSMWYRVGTTIKIFDRLLPNRVTKWLTMTDNNGSVDE